MSEPKTKTIRVVYIGRRLTSKDKLLHFYRPLDSIKDEKNPINTTSDLIFNTSLASKGKRSSDIIGAIYEGEISGSIEGSLTAHNVGSWKYIKHIEDESAIVAWKAATDAHEAENQDNKTTKEMKAVDPMYKALDPIRAAYKKTNVAGKRAIMAKVLEYISR